MERQNYRVWIETEEWAPGQWDPEDSNTDVIVTRDDGSRWIASFFTYKNIQTLTEKNQATGENLAGAYFWSSDMLLIDKTYRQRIEAVIRDLIDSGAFESVFRHIPPEDE
jgi:hypothetical protein